MGVRGNRQQQSSGRAEKGRAHLRCRITNGRIAASVLAFASAFGTARAIAAEAAQLIIYGTDAGRRGMLGDRWGSGQLQSAAQTAVRRNRTAIAVY
jgi:hypothetical protein